MLTVIILVLNLKWIVPTTLMMGAAPAYFTAWSVWRLLSAPFPSWVYVKGDDFLFSTYHRQLLFFFEILSGIEIVFYGELDAIDKLQDGENCIYMSNHQCTVDWVLGSCISLRRGALGRTRYILKDGLRYLPWYGFYLGMHGSIFVKRAKKFNKEKAQGELGNAARNKKPMWLIVFPEGTRFNPDLMSVIKASKEFSESQGHVPLETVLFPRVKAMQVALEQMRTSVDCVYDVTLAYGKTYDIIQKQRIAAPTMQDVLLGQPQKIHVHLRRIPIKEVPFEESKLKEWLYEQFQKKDRLLSDFYNAESGEGLKFQGPSKTKPLALKSVLPSVVLWSGTLAAISAFKESRQFYWKLGLGTASIGILWMALTK